MNPLACRIVLRPRSAFEVLDLATVVVRRDLGPLARLAALVLSPIGVLTLGAWWIEPWAAVGVAWAGGWLVQPAFTAWIARRLFADEVPLAAIEDDLGPILGAIGARLVAVAVLLTCLPVTLGLAIFLAPWFPLWVGEVAQLERVGRRRLVTRSMELFRESVAAMPAGMILGLLPVVGAVTGEIVGQVVAGMLLDVGTPWGLLLEGRATPFVVVGVLAVQPLLAAYRVLSYVDARTRSEGWDVQVAIRGLGEGR